METEGMIMQKVAPDLFMCIVFMVKGMGSGLETSKAPSQLLCERLQPFGGMIDQKGVNCI